MDLKLSEGISRLSSTALCEKIPKNLDFDFQRKIQKIPKSIVWPKQMTETAMVSAIRILAYN